MTIINTNSISGISSITAQGSNGIEFYESSGVNQRLNITSAGRVNIGQASDVDHTLCVAGTDNATSLTGGHNQGIQLQNKSTTDGTYSQIEWRTAAGGRYARIAGIQDDANGNGGQLAFLTENTSGSTVEALRITSGGNVGINDASPSDALTVYKNNIGNPAGITIRNTEASSTYSHARLRLESQNGAAYGEIWADVANAGLRLGYNSSSTVKIDSAGNIVLLSGKGIDFSATDNGNGTMTSELLDDYETGDWTPTIEGINGASGQTYAGSTRGSYTKVGRLVVVSFYCEASVIGTLTGANLVISGLPYNVENEVGAGAGNIAYFSGLANNVSAVMANARNNTDDFFINHVVAGGGASAVNSTNIAINGVRFDGVFSYRTTS